MNNLYVKQLKAICENEPDLIANLSNTSAFLNEILDDINWVGFYFYKNNELVLGPFQGKVACTHIPLNKGVCGYAASHLEIQRIDNVHEFKDHIACDSASKSEIVLPIVKNNQLFGVLDIDSPNYNRFSEDDQKFLEEIVEVITSYIN
jgi:GAF domain-containing protein